VRSVLAGLLAVVLVASVTSGAGAVDLSDLPPSYADDIADAQSAADAAAAELAEAETELGRLEAEIDAVRQRADDTEARLAELRLQVQEVAVSRYTRTGTEVPLIGDADINRQARANALARFVTQDDADAIDEYRAATEDLELARAELDDLVERQRDVLADLEARRGALTEELERLQALEAERQAEIARRQEAERRRQEEERRRREAAEAARRAEAAAAEAASQRTATTTTAGAAAAPSPGPVAPPETESPDDPPAPAPTPAPAPAPASPSGWICPVQGPHSFVDTWGAPRSGGRRHKGVDMMASTGTPVVAPVSGNVTHRGNSIGGLSFHLYGDDGNYYYGTHLSAYGNAGYVSAGTVVGYVGDSGNARGIPHLHFEIHPGGGAAVNPTPTVRAHCP
jgi:septal ring factor EnvC (AmiA/AmiB activator)